MIVSATGGADARALTTTVPVTVTVTDVTEPPGKPAVPVLSDATLNSSEGELDSACRTRDQRSVVMMCGIF